VCAQAKGGIVHQQRAALTRHDVLGLVEGEAAEIADGAERRALVARHDALRRILDDAQGVALGDRAGARGDGSLDPAFVEVERVLADVDENRDRAAQHEGIRRRDEGEGGHDDLVAAFEVEQDRGEVECGGAGRRQQRAGAAGAPFEPFVAAPGERPVALQMMALQSLLDTGLFLARDVGPIEGDEFGGHCLSCLTALRRGFNVPIRSRQIGGFHCGNQPAIARRGSPGRMRLDRYAN
jgi:hypothetical protein